MWGRGPRRFWYSIFIEFLFLPGQPGWRFWDRTGVGNIIQGPFRHPSRDIPRPRTSTRDRALFCDQQCYCRTIRLVRSDPVLTVSGATWRRSRHILRKELCLSLSSCTRAPPSGALVVPYVFRNTRIFPCSRQALTSAVRSTSNTHIIPAHDAGMCNRVPRHLRASSEVLCMRYYNKIKILSTLF